MGMRSLQSQECFLPVDSAGTPGTTAFLYSTTLWTSIAYMVMPFLRLTDDPPFETVNNIIDYGSQIIQVCGECRVVAQKMSLIWIARD